MLNERIWSTDCGVICNGPQINEERIFFCVVSISNFQGAIPIGAAKINLSRYWGFSNAYEHVKKPP